MSIWIVAVQFNSICKFSRVRRISLHGWNSFRRLSASLTRSTAEHAVLLWEFEYECYKGQVNLWSGFLCYLQDILLMNERIRIMNSHTTIKYSRLSSRNHIYVGALQHPVPVQCWIYSGMMIKKMGKPLQVCLQFLSANQPRRWRDTAASEFSHETSSYHIVIGNKFNGTSLYRNWIYWMAKISLAKRDSRRPIRIRPF